MRDTSDMTEDALSEDTMMDCGGDGGGLEDFVELATDIADSSRTIRDAAERLLTLLGVEDDNEDLLFTSEDEGVEVDVDDDDEEDENDEVELENTRLLHQLAASLAQELKYSQQTNCSTASPATRILLQERVSFNNERDQTVEMVVQETNFLKESCNDVTLKDSSCDEFDEENEEKLLFGQNHLASSKYSFGYSYHQTPQVDSFECKEARSLKDWGIAHLERSFRMQEELQSVEEEERSIVERDRQVGGGSWASGWDACAAEALRYLIEDEGLPPHHPTVLAMKNHLQIQRERVFAQYAA